METELTPVITPKPRFDYLDIFKCLAIVLMVVGHCGGSTWFVTYIYSFHMAAFFFVLGFMTDFKKGSTLSYAVKQFMRLMVPFFFISIVFLSVKALLQLIPGYVTPFGYADVDFGTSLKLLFERGDVYSQPLGAIWFLPCLFFASIIMKLLVKACDGKRWLVIVLSSFVAILGFYLISINYQDFLWLLRPTQVLIAQYFICLGYLVGQSPIVRRFINKEHPFVVTGCLAFFLTISILIVALGHFHMNMSDNYYGKPTWYMVIATLSGSMMLLCLSVLLAKLPKGISIVLQHIGKASFAIMIFHFLAIKLFGLFLSGVGYFDYAAIASVVPPDGTSGILRFVYIVLAVAFGVGCYDALRHIPVVNCLVGLNPKWGNYLSKKTEEGLIKLANPGNDDAV